MKIKFYIWLFLPVIFAVYGLFTKRYDILLNSIFTALLLVTVSFFHQKFPIFSDGIYYGVSLFILLSVFAGRTLNIYSFIPYWDKILHFLSGILLVPIGSSLYMFLKGDAKNKFLLFFFCLVFAIACAGIWEIYEFTADSLLGTHSQNASLTDTMWDMILGSASALLSVVFQYLHNKKGTH